MSGRKSTGKTFKRVKSDSNAPAKRVKGKHGREELRTVTRTASRRKPSDVVDDNVKSEDSDSESQSLDEESEDESANHSRMAYGALLTLLKSEQSKKLKNQDDEKDNQEEGDKEEADGEVAGFIEDENDENEENSEAEEQNDVDDSDNESENGEFSYLIHNDPYEVHFNQPSEEYAEREEKAILKNKEKWSINDRKTHDNGKYTSFTQLPPGEPIKTVTMTSHKTSLEQYPLKQRLLAPFNEKYPFDTLTELEHSILKPMLDYQDISLPYMKSSNKFHRKLYALHALNHVFKTRDRVLKNNAKIYNYREALKSGKTAEEIGEEPEIRDQGFTRAKVLILLPTRNACYEVVNELIKLSGTEQQENRKRFNTQFYTKSALPENKPDDFKDAFAGNSNDFFCLGMKLTRKSLKFYTSFYSSDIIIASPIGLSMILKNPDKKKRQDDFISSIEVLIVDRAHQIEAQNWDHMNTVLEYINKIPKEFHDADFSRIRMWMINDQSRLFRQTLVFSEYLTPNINNLITSRSYNVGGKIKFKPVIDKDNCIMNSVGLKIKQIYQRFDSVSPATDPDARFKYFINAALPSLTRSTSYDDGIMIYIPSYYDYLRVKHYMKTSTKITFGAIDEYTSTSKMTRTRHFFRTGKIKVLLYTERLHFFRRFEIAGVKTLLMYSLPSNPLFYKELIRFIGKTIFLEDADLDLVYVKVLYSKWDAVFLERIVGAERTPVMCNTNNELFEFR